MIGLNLNEFIVKSSNDHFNRAKIIELVIKDAMEKNNNEQFGEFEELVALLIFWRRVQPLENQKLKSVRILSQNNSKQGRTKHPYVNYGFVDVNFIEPYWPKNNKLYEEEEVGRKYLYFLVYS